MKNSEYLSKFDFRYLEEAFRQASDIRKFEIQLYWRRASYFWTLIAAAFAGYFAIMAGTKDAIKYELSFVIAAVGFVFTLAWYLVNRGSKYWQENWENHLDQLEDAVTGPLYKIQLSRFGKPTGLEKWVTGPKNVSVSKVNMWVSVFVLVIWLILALFALSGNYAEIVYEMPKSRVFWVHFSVFTVSIIVCIFMCFCARTDQGNYDLKMDTRESRIVHSSFIDE